MAESFNIIEWLENDVLYPEHEEADRMIDPAEINNVLYFALLWNVFEDTLVGAKTAARAGVDRPPSADLKKIRTAVEKMQAERLLNADDFTPYLEEFRHRYLNDEGGLTRFDFNFMRSEERDELNLRAIIEGTRDNSVDVVVGLLTIAWRLRNNLFHGIKFIHELPEQNENFGIVNRVLGKFTRLLKQSGWNPPMPQSVTVPSATPAS